MSIKIDLKDPEPPCNYEGDYLMDPALWFDDLPQPFRMIDQLLSGIVEAAWEAIVKREADRERERGKFRVPLCSKVESVQAVSGVPRVVCSGGRDDIVFVGCSDGLQVLRTSKGTRPKLLASRTTGHLVEQLSAATKGELQLVSAVGGGAMSVFVFTKDYLVLTSPLYDGNSLKVESAVLSPSGTHVAISSAPDGGATPPTIEVQSLPLQAWASELEVELAKQDVGGPGYGMTPGQGQEPPVNYSRVSPVMTIAPPPAFTPCAASEPSQALNSVAAQLLSSIATGSHHLLTSGYLENRRKAFLSLRCDFQTPSPPGNNPPGHHPTYHFLCSQRETFHIAVRWEGHNQMYIYKVESPNKGAQVCPVLVHPHATPITASAVSLDGRTMAIGTKGGAVTFWDHQGGLCRGVVEMGSCMVTSMAFVGSNCVVGTSSGVEIIQLGSKGVWIKNKTVLCSDSLPVKTVIPSFSTRGICCCTTSSGNAVVWNVEKGLPLCQLEFPSATAISTALQCCSLTGEYVFIITYSKLDNKTNLLKFSLPEIEGRTDTDKQSDSPQNTTLNFMEVLEARLCEAIRNEGRA